MSKGIGNAIRTKISPPELAALWGKKPSTIIALIRCGALPAIDVSLPGAKRRRYLIDLADIETFTARRAVVPPCKSPRIRRPRPTDPDYVNYF
jgi:hypothetical protein